MIRGGKRPGAGRKTVPESEKRKPSFITLIYERRQNENKNQEHESLYSKHRL